MDWHEYFITMSILVSRKSKDRSTRVGAVIVGKNNEVLSTGFNGFPRGVDDDIEEYHERPTKYLITEHAERNAIYNAVRHGIKLDDSVLYLPYEPTPCCNCARAVIQSGIKKIYGTTKTFNGAGEQWKKEIALAKEMLNHAGVEQISLEFNQKHLDITNPDNPLMSINKC